MDAVTIAGVLLTPLKRIPHPKGDILHGMKKSDPGFSGFGEAYFSTVHVGAVKGWNRHRRMVLNFVVPAGEIRFVAYDDRPDSASRGRFLEARLSANNYQRLTIPPGVWVAFQGIGSGLNLLLNIGSLEHDPGESEKRTLDEIPYSWDPS